MAVQLPLEFEFKPDHNFASFYPGCNQEIVDHLKDGCSSLTEQQIFIWGSKGLGKSHLLQACCLQAHQEQKRSFYYPLNAADLPDIAILEGLEEFDLVCFDDIEQLAGNGEWERAFFYFYNRQRDRGHRLILSASMPPNEIPLQLPDLITRLGWGLTFKLKMPSEEDRIEVLSSKANALGFDITPPVGRFLLAHYSRDVPSLWALLEKIDHATLAAKRKLTIPFLKQILGDIK